MNCEQAKSLIPLFLYGELLFDEEEAVETHLESCAGCRSEVVRQTIWHRALDRAALTPPAALLAGCRQELMARIRQEPRTGGKRASVWRRLAGWWNPGGIPRWVWQPAAAAVLLAIGFGASRLLIHGSYRATETERVESRVRYIEPEDSGRVQLVVEETRQRVLNGRLDEEPIRRLLLAAVRDPSDPGVRVESINALGRDSNTREVRQALLNALRQDPNAGVRLKAIEGLKPYAEEPETRRTLTEVLLNDDNPGVRTQAVDLLMRRREPDVVGVLQQLLQKEDNGYIRMRSRQALRAMNASEGTF